MRRFLSSSPSASSTKAVAAAAPRAPARPPAGARATLDAPLAMPRRGRREAANEELAQHLATRKQPRLAPYRSRTVGRPNAVLKPWQEKRLERLDGRMAGVQRRLERDTQLMLNPPDEKKHLKRLPLGVAEFFADPARAADRLAGYELLLRVHAVKGTMASAEGVWAAMEAEGVRPDLMAHTAFVKCCAQHGAVDRAFTAVERMREAGYAPDVVAMGALVHACALNGHLDRAFAVVAEMEAPESAVRPNEVVYTSLMRGCLMAGDVDRAWGAYDAMFRAGVLPDTITYNVAIQMCARRRETERALGMLEMMRNLGERPDKATYEQLIAACASRKDYYLKAFELFESFVGQGFRPTVYTFNRLLHVSHKAGDLAAVLKTVRTMDSFRVPKTATTFNTVLGAIAGTQSKLVQVVGDSLLTQTQRIELAADVLREVERTLRGGVKADTLNSMLRVITRACHLRKARSFWDTEFARRGVRHDAHSYFAMVRMYCQARRLPAALDMYAELKALGGKGEFRPLHGMFSVLLRRCGGARMYRTSAGLLDDMRAAGLEPSEFDLKVAFQGKPEWEVPINWERHPDSGAWRPQTDEDLDLLANQAEPEPLQHIKARR